MGLLQSKAPAEYYLCLRPNLWDQREGNGEDLSGKWKEG